MPLGFYDYKETMTDLIVEGLGKAGAIADEDAPSAGMMRSGRMAFNRILKDISHRYKCPWHIREITLDLSSTTDNYAQAEEGVVNLVDAKLRWDTKDYPVEVLTWLEFEQLSDRLTRVGRPYYIALNMQLEPYIHVYPKPDIDDYDLIYQGMVLIEDADAPSDYPELLSAYYRGFVYLLGSELGDKYGLALKERAYYAQQGEGLIKQAHERAFPMKTNNTVRGAY